MSKIILPILSSLCWIIAIYSLRRAYIIGRIYSIRRKWTESDDKRWYEYSYEEMKKPSKQNWFGVKAPRDKDFSKESQYSITRKAIKKSK